jgi:hypothetical protein
MIQPEVVAPPARRPWYRAYAIALVPILAGFAIAGGMMWRTYTQIRDMDRLVVPGERDLTLTAGDHVAFLEARSVVDGVAYSNDRFEGSCNLTDASSHQPVALASTSASTSYSFGSFSGQSVFGFTIPHDGTYHLACTGDARPAVIAIGGGIGMSILLAIAGALGGLIVAAVMALRIRKRRKRAA